MKNRKLLLIVSLVLALTMSLGGTLAYLQDSDSDVNVMTLGSVTITQNEQERNADGELVPFTPNKPAMPAVGPIDWADEGVMVNGVEYKVFTKELKNVVDKIVTVTNTGKSDAYVRTIVAIEAPEGDPHDLIHMGYNDSGVSMSAPYLVEIDGVEYVAFVFTYADALGAGKTSAPSLLQLFLDSKTTNTDVAKFGDAWEVLVLSQAVQADGFADATTALDTAFNDGKKIDNASIIGWFEGWEGWSAETGEIGTPGKDWPSNDVPGTWVSTADELVAALEAGEDVALTGDVNISPANMSNAYGKTGINVKNGQTIDGNGNTLDIKGAGGTWDSGINTTGGLIKNITVTGSFRGIFINHNSTHSEPVVLENVIIDGTTYTISCDQGMNQTLTATNSTFNGWTSYAATLGNAKFVDCSFGEGAGYAFCRPYAPTEFVGCAFEAGYTVDPVAAVTFENCTIGGVDLTADNLADLVTKTSNATVK